MTTTETATIVNWRTELQKVVGLFSSEKLPEACEKLVINAPEKPCTKWSFGNQLLMLLAGTTDARGFRQWQQVNRWPRKGSHAFYILGPVTKEVQGLKCSICGKVVRYRDEHEEHSAALYEAQNAKIEVVIGFKTIPVFRFEDTEGKELPAYKPAEVPPLYHVAQKWGYAVKYERLFLANGQINYAAKTITLQTEEWDTFFHELGHGADKQEHGDLSKDTAENETVADLVATVLSRLYGRPVDNFRWNHIAMYASDKTPEAVGRLCLKVLQRTEKALKLILETSRARGMTATDVKKPSIVRSFSEPSDSNPGVEYQVIQWDNGALTCECPSFVRGRNQRGKDLYERICKHTDRVRAKLVQEGKAPDPLTA